MWDIIPKSSTKNDSLELGQIMFIIAGVIAVFLGIIINLLSFISLVSDKKLRVKPITILILNISVSDFCYCASAIPMHLLQYLDFKLFQKLVGLQYLSFYVRYASCAADYTTISLIALERSGP